MKCLFFVAVCVLLLSSLFSTEILACSCSPKPPIYEVFKGGDAVFIGKVTKFEEIKTKEVEEDEEYEVTNNIFHFQISEAFKGVKGKSLKINAGSKNSCYSGFTVGETYLIYASKEDDDEFHYSGYCSRSEVLEGAQHQLFFIREMLKGKPESQIYGSVVRYDTLPQTGESRRTNLQGIKVVVENDERRFETTTDKMGIFRFDKIPEGQYTVKPIAPDKYRIFFPTNEKIQVTSDKKVGERDAIGIIEGYNSFFTEFTLGWKNELSGKIYDADGNPVKRACVKVLPVAAVNNAKDFTDSQDYDFDCKDNFSIIDVTPGSYVLAIETYAPLGKKNKIRTFYPQALTPDKAQIFNIEETSQLNFDIKLPASQTVRNIEGEVVWSNGISLGDNAWVELKETEISKGETDWNYERERTDTNGKFVLQAFENAEYWLHISTDADVIVNGEESEVEVKAKPIKIKSGKNNEKLKIVLQIPEGFSGS